MECSLAVHLLPLFMYLGVFDLLTLPFPVNIVCLYCSGRQLSLGSVQKDTIFIDKGSRAFIALITVTKHPLLDELS